jgi:protoheme IX farnesyltransferase
LTKPRIIELLLVTTVPTMFLAQRGVPSWWLVAGTLIGGTLSAGSANTFNMVYDRDIDAHMNRTSQPAPRHRGSDAARRRDLRVLASCRPCGSPLFVNVLSAVLSLAAIALYAVGYTMILKRRTVAEHRVGRRGRLYAGAHRLVGRHQLGRVGRVVLFLVIFFWTPPHYWPLSMRFKDDYAHAGVPMLPVVETNVTSSGVRSSPTPG